MYFFRRNGVCEKMHTIVLLAVLSLSAGVDLYAQHIPDLYAMGKYDECLDACNKSIDKKRELKEAYLYKSKVYTKRAEAQMPCDDCIIMSLSAWRALTFKDADSSFRTLHAADIDTIFQVAFHTADSLFTLGENRMGGRITDALLALRENPESIYLKGRMTYAEGDLYHATKLFNEAARGIWLGWKETGTADASGLKVFTTLSSALVEFNDYVSACTVLDRALVIFGKEAQVSYLQFLDEEVLGKSYQIPHDSLGSIFLEAYDQLVEGNVEGARSGRDAYLIFLATYAENHSASWLETLVCPRYPDKATLLTDTLAGMAINDCQWKGRANDLWADAEPGWNRALAVLFECSDESPDELLLRTEDRLGLLPAVKFYTAYAEMEPVGWENIGLGLQDKVTAQLFSDGYSNELYRAHLLLPGKDKVHDRIASLAGKEIMQLIAEGRFSEAGTRLRVQWAANPGDPELEQMYREWVIEDYRANYLGSHLSYEEMAWTGNTASCDAGTVSDITYARMLQRINYVRRLAGIPDSNVFNEEWNAICQETALMMHAEMKLSHGPKQPWKCFSEEGKQGAGMSNLSLGYGGVGALMGQIGDGGGGNISAGHRRWILNPFTRVFGMGTTPEAMALWVLGGNGSRYEGDVFNRQQPVTWPCEGYFPAPLLLQRWSFSLYHADFSNASVSVTHNGKEIELTRHEPDNGYGLNTLVWDMRGLPYGFEEESSYIVHISGVKVDGQVKEFTYTIIFLPIVG
jgi:hypothetical protein